MSKILWKDSKYNEGNTTSIINRGTYNTGFTVQDLDLIVPVFGWLDKELMKKLCNVNEQPNFTEAESKEVSNLLKEKLEKPIDNLDLNNPLHRLVSAHTIINSIPKGAKDGVHTLLMGFSGLGKTTYAIQEAGNIYRSLKHYLKKDGTPKCKIYYYQAEPGAVDAPRMSYLTGMDQWDYENGLVIRGGADQSTVDFVSLIMEIHSEKTKNFKDYVIRTMATDGTIRFTMAPSLVVLDSFSVLSVDKYEQKMASSFKDGKDGSKESDPMRALQVKSTMLNNVGLLKYCDEANIQIYFLAHVGNDMGDAIGHQTLQMYKGVNSKLGFKMKGVPNGMGFLMNRSYSMYSTVKADVLNDMYKRDDFIFLANTLVEKARGSKVYKDKTLPLAFMGEGKFNNTWSLFYYWHKQLGNFDFVKGILPGYADKISTSRLSNLIDNPVFNIILMINVFNEVGLDKMYSISEAQAKPDVSTMLNNMNLNDLIKSLGDPTEESPMEITIAEDLGLHRVLSPDPIVSESEMIEG